MYTPKTEKEKRKQHKFFFWYKKENQDWIRNELTKVKRFDLIERLLGNNKQTAPSNKPAWLADKHKQSDKFAKKKKHVSRKKRR